ncbi:hypothetical protein ACS2B2_25725 [Bacillus cereus group sp. BceL297]|uniref:hypothetical protein n=1 Tax=unclassified Bacillus cereus group TaxID=2750818 RepID=UPI003F260C52
MMMNIFHEEAKIDTLLKFVKIKTKQVENKEVIVEQFSAYLEGLAPGYILEIENGLFDCNSTEEIVQFIRSKTK